MTTHLDVYGIFQAFADNWMSVESDIARLETEGWNICAEVEPNMVTKKDAKTKKTVEEQKGWKGKIMPFDLVKSVFYTSDFEKMSELTAEAESKISEYTEIWEDMEDEAKSVICKDDDETAFDTKKFKPAIKSGVLDKNAIASIKAIQDSIATEKTIRKSVKNIESELENKAKEKIESLTESEIDELLETKWITPIINAISNVGESVLNKFVTDFTALEKKYSDPMSDLSEKIEETSAALKESLNDLVGNDTDMEAIRMLLEDL